MAKSPTFEAELLQALLDLAHNPSGAQPQQRVRDLLRGPFLRFIAKRVRGRSDVDDLVAEALLDVVNGVGKCRALQQPLAPDAADAAHAWTFAVARNRARRAWRDKYTGADPLDEAGHEQQADTGPGLEEVAAEAEERSSQRDLLGEMEASAWQVIQTGHPPGLRKLATQNGVGSSRATFEQQVKAFKLLRGQGEEAVEVGRRLGITEGPERRIQNHVAQWAKRGAAALHIGARAALERERDAERRRQLQAALTRLPVREPGAQP